MASARSYPEYGLWGRYERAYNWTPEGIDALLDAGCAWGYGTRFFTAKAKKVVGLDPNDDAIDVARGRYPHLTFFEGGLEHTDFEPESFDAIVCCDVLEHVDNDRDCLSEIARILRPGGVLILTVPHDGLLSFLDPDNYGSSLLAWAKWRMPWLYRWYRRRTGRPAPPEQARPVRGAEVHRHYSLEDLVELLDRSDFAGGYEVLRVARTGFLLEALVLNTHYFLKRVLPGRAQSVMARALAPLSALDYRIPYSRLANNIAVQIVKQARPAGAAAAGYEAEAASLSTEARKRGPTVRQV
jgi:SAM-dependent methyltransferase